MRLKSAAISLVFDKALVARRQAEHADEDQEKVKTALATTIDDMGFLRDQITTTEVNMARVFNWDVKNRRKLGLVKDE